VARWASETARQFEMALKNGEQNVLSAARRMAGARCGAKKQSNQHRLNMNSTSQNNPVLNHDEIARLACQIWQSEGSQNGRDEEYWLQAERQLREMRQQGIGPQNNEAAKRKVSPANDNKSARQPAIQTGSNPHITQKRVAGRM
jgi:hypothetical protein